MKKIILLSLLLISSELMAQQDSIVWGTVYNIFHHEYASDGEFFAQVDKDIAGMKAAHIRQVLIFPMSQWDAQTKQLRWTRTDYLIKKIEEANLKFVPLMLKEEQCGYFLPMWKFREIPGLWEKCNNSSLGKNSRENIDFDDSLIFPLIESYFREVISRYGKNPALSFYNIWNEPHYNSESQAVVEKYRLWLKKKYTTLNKLSQAWGEDYSDWSEVSPFLNSNWASSMPQIDYTLFRNELRGELLGKLSTMLRKYDTTHAINVNPVGSSWVDFSDFRGYSNDNWVFTKYTDICGTSFYPDGWERSNKLTQKYPPWLYDFFFSTIRSASMDKRYILTELFTNTQNGFALNGYLDSTFNARLAWTAFSNDCKGIIYWKWEPFFRGRQSLGRGLAGINGQLAERGTAVQAIGEELDKAGEKIYAHNLDKPQVGILVDMVGLLKLLEQSAEPKTSKFMYESIAGIYKANYEANLNVDMIRTDRPLAAGALHGYKVLYLPFQIVLRAGIVEQLKQFVKDGGWLVADARFASLNEFDVAFRKSPGLGMDEVFGVDRKDWLGTTEKIPVYLEKSGLFGTGVLDGIYFRDYLTVVPDAEVHARFADGKPAIVSRNYGKGKAIYCAFPLGGSYYYTADTITQKLISDIATRAGVETFARFLSLVNSSVVIKSHSGNDSKILYLINNEPVSKSGQLSIDVKPSKISSVTDLINDTKFAVTEMQGKTIIPVTIPSQGTLILYIKLKE